MKIEENIIDAGDNGIRYFSVYYDCNNERKYIGKPFDAREEAEHFIAMLESNEDNYHIIFEIDAHTTETK